MSEPWDSHQEEWKHRVGKGDLHGTTAGRTGGGTTQALWNLANFITSPRCWRWSCRMWWLPAVFALALIWSFFVILWSQNAYSLPQQPQAPAAVPPEGLPQSALPTFSCFSQRVLSHSQKKRLRHLFFFKKKLGLKNIQKICWQQCMLVHNHLLWNPKMEFSSFPYPDKLLFLTCVCFPSLFTHYNFLGKFQ